MVIIEKALLKLKKSTFSPFQVDELLHRNKQVNCTESFKSLATDYGEVRYWDSGGDKPVLLKVPDGPCFLEHFAEFMEKAKKDWRVVIFDMPGFGESFPKNDYRHSFEQACHVISAVVKKLNLTDITMSFSCANGFYSVYYAKRFPESIKKLVLVQTPGFEGMRPWLERSVPAPIKVPYLGQILVHLQRYKIPNIWFRMALPKNAPQCQTWSKLSVDKIHDGCCNSLASVVQGLMQMDEKDLKGLRKIPVTMVWGAKDFSHKNTDHKTLLDILPHANIEVWDDVGHFPNLEQPDRFLKLISYT